MNEPLLTAHGSASAPSRLSRPVATGAADHRRRPQHDRHRPRGDPPRPGLQPPVVEHRDRPGRPRRHRREWWSPRWPWRPAGASDPPCSPRRERSRRSSSVCCCRPRRPLALAGYLLAFALPAGLAVLVVGVVRRYRVARWPVLALLLVAVAGGVAAGLLQFATPSARCSQGWPPASGRAWPGLLLAVVAPCRRAGLGPRSPSACWPPRRPGRRLHRRRGPASHARSRCWPPSARCRTGWCG